jgi:AcrR family transcriptional regulator
MATPAADPPVHTAEALVAPRARNPRGQGERLRAALIDAAIDVLSEVADVEALSVRAVTARAGVSPTALYLHFADKDELLTAVKERCFAELRGYVLEAEQAAAPDARRQADAMCLAYLAFAAEQPGHYRVLFHTRRPSGEDGGPSAIDATEALASWPPEAAEAFRDLARGVGRCLNDGRDVFEVATMVWTSLHGFAALRAIRHSPFPSAGRYVAVLLDAHLDPD